MGASLLHNMLLRELALVGVLVIVLIIFYIRFRAAGKKEYVRTRERRLAQVVSSARKQLIVVLILLAGVLVYDRVLPHFGIGAQAAQSATSSQKSSIQKLTKKERAARLKKAESVSKQAKSLSESISKSSSVAAKASSSSAASASSAKAASASLAKAASAAASSASASKAAAVDPKVKAVAAVQAHMAQYPSETSDTRIDNVGVIQYTTDYTGVPAYEVGLYQTQVDGSSVAVHMYFYYADGNVTKAY